MAYIYRYFLTQIVNNKDMLYEGNQNDTKDNVYYDQTICIRQDVTVINYKLGSKACRFEQVIFT